MAYPTDLVRTKNWGTEVLTDSDLEGQLDLIIDWLMAAMNESTGHDHSSAENQGPKINLISGAKVTSQAQGDIIYASSATAFARLAAGTKYQFLMTNGASANPAWAATPAIEGAFKNLRITRGSATQVTVSADMLVLMDTNNIPFLATSVSETIAITTSGASGLVASLTEAANTWYYIWIARKSSDGTVNGYLSTTTSRTTFLTQVDSGYDQVALVGAVRNDNSSNMVNFIQQGRKVKYVASQVAYNTTAAAFTAVDVTAYIPASLSDIGDFIAASGASQDIQLSNDSAASNAITANAANVVQQGAIATVCNQIYAEFMILTANTIYVKGSANCIVYVDGYEINKL